MVNISLIGLGLVGQSLAARFLGAGHRVFGFDVEPQRCDEFAKQGGEVVAGVHQSREAASVCVLSLPTSDIVQSVLKQLENRLTGMLVIDTTTGDPETSLAIGQSVKAEGGDYLDATIVGSSALVRTGEVIVLVGGEKEPFAKSTPLLDCFAKKTFYLGIWGSGARMKLVVNLVLGLNRAVLAEGLAFVRQVGIEPAQALEVLQSGVAYSKVMDLKGKKMVSRNYATEAKLAQHHKDVKLILDSAARAKITLPLSRLHDDLLNTAEAMGLGDSDNSANLRSVWKVIVVNRSAIQRLIAERSATILRGETCSIAR